MRLPPCSLALLLLALPTAASADRLGPAVDLVVGQRWTGDAGGDLEAGGALYLRLGLGAHLGGVAVLAHAEHVGSVTPTDEVVDSSRLSVAGAGAAVRVDLTRGPGLLVQLTAGWTFRRLAGTDEVLRTCSLYGGCDAGFWREVPRYTANAPMLTLAVGYRFPGARGRSGPQLAAEVGLGQLELDRGGRAPDAATPLVWLGLRLALGAGGA